MSIGGEFPISLRQLGTMALRSITETEKHLNDIESWEKEAVLEFCRALQDSPFLLQQASQEKRNLFGDDGPPPVQNGEHSTPDLPDFESLADDDMNGWLAIWTLSIDVYGLAVQDVTRPDEQRNTWFARHLNS
ncbi:MAG: hypothetical protein HQL42_06705 [Alphaproteobacteria bacterium]|nr:hypothetical protein [Alphaproteobacteria bacterium]